VGVLLLTDTEIRNFSDFLTGFAIVSVFAVPTSYVPSILLGIPFLITLDRLGIRYFWLVISGAAILGSAVFLLFLALSAGSGFFAALYGVEWLLYILAGAGLAICVAISFLLIGGITSASRATR